MRLRLLAALACATALASCARHEDMPTAPGLHSITGRVVLTGSLVDANSQFLGTRVVTDADGVGVQLVFGTDVVATATTVHGAYRFGGLANGAYVVRTAPLVRDFGDQTGQLTIANADIVVGDTLRIDSYGDI